jgi:hypothetical protein
MATKRIAKKSVGVAPEEIEPILHRLADPIAETFEYFLRILLAVVTETAEEMAGSSQKRVKTSSPNDPCFEKTKAATVQVCSLITPPEG